MQLIRLKVNQHHFIFFTACHKYRQHSNTKAAQFSDQQELHSLCSAKITENIHSNTFIIHCSLNVNELISTLNANDMDCACEHQGCIISDQQYLHSSVIHPIKVTQGIFIGFVPVASTL